MSSDQYADGFADGVDYAVRLVLKRLHETIQEPRKQPSDRRGKIVALGLLLQELAPGLDYKASDT